MQHSVLSNLIITEYNNNRKALFISIRFTLFDSYQLIMNAMFFHTIMLDSRVIIKQQSVESLSDRRANNYSCNF